LISPHPEPFDFEPRHTGILSARPFKSHRKPAAASSKELDEALIGNSLAMENLKRSILLFSSSSETVLITGESGTGKELIARAIHDLSSRSSKPFVAVNCGALAESLLESELFGHVKGAFTGAATNKKGFFETASGGTIFLDEFAEMSLAMQQSLLRVLQEGTVRPVGSTGAKEIEIDARIVVATHHDLKHDIAQGKFRHDLYYRVNVLQISSPALRHRPEDISTLATHFVRKYNDRNTAKVSETISAEVLDVLEAYSWPGNVRELENIIKRLALCASGVGVITIVHLRSVSEFDQLMSTMIPIYADRSTLSQISRKMNRLSRTKQEPEAHRDNAQLKEYCLLLEGTSGNLSEAARQLNMKRTTLRKRILSLQKKCATG